MANPTSTLEDLDLAPTTAVSSQSLGNGSELVAGHIATAISHATERPLLNHSSDRHLEELLPNGWSIEDMYDHYFASDNRPETARQRRQSVRRPMLWYRADRLRRKRRTTAEANKENEPEPREGLSRS